MNRRTNAALRSERGHPISRAQLVALQTLYSYWSAHTTDDAGDPRAVRLAWATEQLGRTISSFKELTADEGRRLIDVLKVSLGQKLNERPRSFQPRIQSRELAQAAGTAGRRTSPSTPIYLVSAADLARLDNAIARLGWSRERFDAWLRSATSPLGRRSNPQIRTLADANRVWWALKPMLKLAGLWRRDDEQSFTHEENSPAHSESNTSLENEAAPSDVDAPHGA